MLVETHPEVLFPYAQSFCRSLTDWERLLGGLRDSLAVAGPDSVGWECSVRGKGGRGGGRRKGLACRACEVHLNPFFSFILSLLLYLFCSQPHCAAYAATLEHLSVDLSPEAFLALLPSGGPLGYYLPYVERSIQHAASQTTHTMILEGTRSAGGASSGDYA